MVSVNGVEYYSLYEYLGKAAGPNLGTKVNAEAINQTQPLVKQHIENPAYKGKVLCYTKKFLDSYFDKKHNPNLEYFHTTKDDDLPF